MTNTLAISRLQLELGMSVLFRRSSLLFVAIFARVPSSSCLPGPMRLDERRRRAFDHLVDDLMHRATMPQRIAFGAIWDEYDELTRKHAVFEKARGRALKHAVILRARSLKYAIYTATSPHFRVWRGEGYQ